MRTRVPSGNPKLDKIYNLVEEIEMLREKMEDKREKYLTCTITDHAVKANVEYFVARRIKSVHILKAHCSRIHDAFWSKDDHFAISIGSDNCIVLWNVHTGLIYNMIDASHFQPVSADLSADLEYLFCGGLCAKVAIYKLYPSQTKSQDTRGGEEPYSEYDVCNNLEHESNINTIKCINSDELMVVAEGEGVVIWDLNAGVKKFSMKPFLGTVTCAKVFSDSRRIVGGSSYGTITLWDTRLDQKEVMTIEAHESDVSCIDILENSCDAFLSGSDDTSVQLYDPRLDAPIARYCDPVWKNFDGKVESIEELITRPDISTVNTIAATPSGRMFLSGCGDSYLYYWDILRFEDSLWQREMGGPVKKLEFSHKGHGLINLVWDGKNQVRIMAP